MEKWYMEYEVVANTIDGEEVFRGVICANSFTEATKDLEEFYGQDLVKISYLSWGMETVYEFENSENHWRGIND